MCFIGQDVRLRFSINLTVISSTATMQNNKVRVEPVSELSSYREVLQDAMDEVEQVARDHKAQLERLQDALEEAEQASMH